MTFRTRMRRDSAILASLAILAVPIYGAGTAHAQTVNPVVDVCTGLSLDRSLVTDVVGDVVVPALTPIQSTFNDLLDLTVNVGPLNVLAPLDLGLAQILADAGTGNPLAIQVLDPMGNVVAPGDCNLSAASYRLDAEGGLAIGGNAITGLGAEDQPALAGELDAIAFGNAASTAVGATGAIALGTGASAEAANSVALGAGSLADRGALTAYTAPGLAAPVSSVGSVSFGAAGAERQLTNVAAATAATDATTLGQVQGLIAEAATPLAVQYDTDAQGTVTLGGAAGTLVTNLADGRLAADSSDAVNGSQLFATNQDVAALEASAVRYDDGTSAAITLDGAGGTVITNVAAGAVTPASTDAVNGAQLSQTNLRIAQNTAAIAAIDPVAGNAVSYDDPSLDSLTLGGAAGTTVANLADGALAADSSEAVNGAQLFATNQNVTTNTAAIAGLDDRVADLDGTVQQNVTQVAQLTQRVDNVPVGYVSDTDPTVASAVPTGTAAFRAASGGSLRVTNVASGTLAAGSTDAVNGSQLAATNAQVAANRTDIDTNTADIATISNNLAGSTVVAVQYSDPDAPTQSNGGTITNDVTLVGADAAAPVRLHNVANGTLAGDAVNLGQLQSGLSAAMADATAYTDSRFAVLSDSLAQVSFDLEELREDAFAGTASAMALAGIPQTMDAGRAMIGGAVGHYRGETAFAVGASTAFNDGRGVFKAAGTLDTDGHGGFSAGAGFSF